MAKRARNSSLFPIEFFKIYLSEFSSNQLTFPPVPSKLLINNIPNNATLKDHQGKLWHVKLDKTEKVLIVQDGWQDFVARHSLSDGDCLIFEYDGNALFNVEIYGINGLKRREVLDNYMFDFHVKEEERETVQITSQPLIQKKNISKPKRRKGRGRPSKLGTTAVGQLEKAKLASITNPYFQIIMKRSRSSRYCMHIPMSVVKINKLIIKDKLKLRDETGKLWPVKVTPRQDIGGRITAGWVDFYREHKLKPGDKCIFEFMLQKNNVGRILQVHIVRRKPTRTQLVMEGKS